MTLQSINDLLDANSARKQAGIPALLTEAGYDFLNKMSKRMRSADVTQAGEEVVPTFDEVRNG
jgi:hypothetical protein